jgi:hypothetical protein
LRGLGQGLSVAVIGVSLSTCAAPRKPPTPVTPPPAPVVPVLQPVQLPLAQPAGGWEDWPLLPGDWRFEAAGTGAIARFDTAGGAAMTLRCDRPGSNIMIAVAGMGRARDLAVRTTGGTETLTGAPDASGGLTLALAPQTGVLDRILFSRGRFALSNSAGQGIALPAWAEVARLVEFCRGAA